ncbi:hypothetical protein EAO71_02275 [Streptomyces sp. ms191]|nr:hypothetical protein EAO71_02275 [Streptomyces sp. ms191]
MPDTGPAALVVIGCIVHIARLDPSRTSDIAGARVSTPSHVKRVGDVIFPSSAPHTLRATLLASCSLVSLAVQSLRSM